MIYELSIENTENFKTACRATQVDIVQHEEIYGAIIFKVRASSHTKLFELGKFYELIGNQDKIKKLEETIKKLKEKEVKTQKTTKNARKTPVKKNVSRSTQKASNNPVSDDKGQNGDGDKKDNNSKQ